MVHQDSLLAFGVIIILWRHTTSLLSHRGQ